LKAGQHSFYRAQVPALSSLQLFKGRILERCIS